MNPKLGSNYLATQEKRQVGRALRKWVNVQGTDTVWKPLKLRKFFQRPQLLELPDTGTPILIHVSSRNGPRSQGQRARGAQCPGGLQGGPIVGLAEDGR